ncbi:MAG: hypothetical protein IKR89_07545 [Bacteroidaceae bacterium]|nr:hypothetical protein [Bacteroidaceae bacterium]
MATRKTEAEATRATAKKVTTKNEPSPMDKAFEDCKPLIKAFFDKGFEYSVFFDTLNMIIQNHIAVNSRENVSINVWKLIRLKDELNPLLRGLERVEWELETQFRSAPTERIIMRNNEQHAEIERLRAVLNEREEQIRSLRAETARAQSLCDALQKQVTEQNENRPTDKITF